MAVGSILDLARQRSLRDSSLMSWVPVGTHTANASLGSAVTLTRPEGANAIIVTASGQNVRYTVDGTTPTATTGLLILTTVTPQIIPVADGVTIKVIESAASATLNYQWVRVE